MCSQSSWPKAGQPQRADIIILPMKEVANEAEEEEEESKSDDPKLDFEVIDALLDALDLEE